MINALTVNSDADQGSDAGTEAKDEGGSVAVRLTPCIRLIYLGHRHCRNGTPRRKDGGRGGWSDEWGRVREGGVGW